MFSVFSHTSNSKIKKQDAAVLERHQMEKRQQEATARGQYKATEDMEETFMSANKSKSGLLGANANKKKYDFVDLEDGEDEDELSETEKDDMRRTNDAMDAVQQKVQRMNLIAKGMNRRIGDQNELLTNMAEKVSLLHLYLVILLHLLTFRAERCCRRPCKMPRLFVHFLLQGSRRCGCSCLAYLITILVAYYRETLVIIGRLFEREREIGPREIC